MGRDVVGSVVSEYRVHGILLLLRGWCVLVSGRWNACNVDAFLFYHPYVCTGCNRQRPRAEAGMLRVPSSLADRLAPSDRMGRGKQGGRGAASAEIHGCSVAYIIRHEEGWALWLRSSACRSR
jgi:hypothetical protein